MQEQWNGAGAAPLWYAVHCKTGREQHAAAALNMVLSVTVYLPTVRQRTHGCVREVPFFPAYLFVYANLHEIAPSSIQSIPNVIRMVTFGQRPQPIAASIIEYLRARVTALDAGGTLLGHGFQPGDTARFKSGPFRGLEATFQGSLHASDRVRVLLEFLGDMREFETGVERLERVQGTTIAQPPRRTRGKGRAIRQH